jgi:hypothetical protein
VTNPLFSGDASGDFGKQMIFKRGGIVTKYFSPRNPNMAAQVERRERFQDIQKVLDWMKESLRVAMKESIGATWHQRITGYLIGAGWSVWDEFEGVFESFTAGHKQGWIDYCPTIETNNDPGMVFYMLACAVNRLAPGAIVEAEESNFYNVGNAWYGGIGEFTDLFNGEDGAMDKNWTVKNNAWNIVSGAVTCVPTLGAELFTNRLFDTDSAWFKGSGWTISGGKGNHAGAVAGQFRQTVGAVNKLISISYDVDSISGNVLNVYFGTTNGAYMGASVSTTGSKFASRFQSGAYLGFYGTANCAAVLDNASAKEIDQGTAIASIEAQSGGARIKVKANILYDTMAGVVGWLDNPEDPKNYILVCHDGGARLIMYKVVGGVATMVSISTLATYAAGAEIKLEGTLSNGVLTLNMFYNGIARGGVNIQVSEAGIVSNKRFGMVSTSGLNALDGFVYVRM